MATVFVRKVGETSGGKMMKAGTLTQIKTDAKTRLNIVLENDNELNIFNKDVGEIEDVVLLKDGDVIYAGVSWTEITDTSSNNKSWFKNNTSKFLNYHRKQSSERQRFNKRKKSENDKNDSDDSENEFTETKRPHKEQKKMQTHRKEEFHLNVGVLKFNTKAGKLVQVRKKDGGGIHQVNVQGNDDYDTISRKMTEFFKRNSPNLVSPSATLVVVDMSHKKICDRISGKFNVQNYLEYLGKADRPSKVTLYVLNWQDYDKYTKTRSEQTDENDDNDSLPAVDLDGSGILQQDAENSDSQPLNDGLIGSSISRHAYFQELERELKESEMADRAKEQDRLNNERYLMTLKEKEDEEMKVLAQLKKERRDCLPPEPRVDEDHLLVNVRHVKLGIITRAFETGSKMFDVYNWIGSLDESPRYFALLSPLSECLVGERYIKDLGKRFTLSMCERDAPVVVEESQHLPGIPENEYVTDDIMVISDYPPDQIMCDDPVLSQGTKELMENLEHLEKKRQTMKDKLVVSDICVIDKSNIIEDVINLYRSEAIVEKNLSVCFESDHATGDGVLREMFSLFWDSFLSRYGEGANRFIFTLQPGIRLEEYEILGRIISHQFILCALIS